MAPRLNSSGIDLLGNFLKCNPRSRISAKDAMFHDYFSILPTEIYDLSDSQSIFSISSIRLSKQLPKAHLEDVNV